MLRFFLPLCLLLIAPTLHAADARPSIPSAETVTLAGESIITADWRAALLASGPQTSAFGRVEAGDVTTVKLVTREQPDAVYKLQATIPNHVALKQGDTLLIRFAARSLKSDFATGSTKLRVGFSKASPNWDSSTNGEIGVGAAWQRFDIPFTCKNDFAPNEAKFYFTFGYPAQIAEIADVQLLRYAAGVSPADLPKTRRFADLVTPEKLQSEIARIAAMHAQFAAVADPAPAHGRILNVSPAGRANGDGSAARPYATIPQALAVVQPGDTVLVAAGTYREPRGIAVKTSGRADAWIKLKAAPGARPKIISSGWSGVELRGGISFIEVDGFELEWVRDPSVTGDNGATIHGVGLAPMYASHHLRLLNNVVHGFGTGGIASLDCDYVLIEGNVIYNTAKTSPYGGSGISLCRAFDFDQKPGYHNVVSRNVVYDNELKVVTAVFSGGSGHALTDGNGIIIDSLDRSRLHPLIPHTQDRNGPLAPYHGQTLVENNLVYNNGGRGIHLFRSSNIDVVNNTTYLNQKTPDIDAGELTAIEGSHIVLLNNIAYGRKDKRGNTQDGSNDVIWANNLLYNTADVLIHPGLIEADPHFVAPALDAPAEGFHLQPDSPALGKGVVPAAPATDLTGQPRPTAGPIDLGAFQRSP